VWLTEWSLNRGWKKRYCHFWEKTKWSLNRGGRWSSSTAFMCTVLLVLVSVLKDQPPLLWRRVVSSPDTPPDTPLEKWKGGRVWGHWSKFLALHSYSWTINQISQVALSHDRSHSELASARPMLWDCCCSQLWKTSLPQTPFSGIAPEPNFNFTILNHGD
jgi:hypothetical protein